MASLSINAFLASLSSSLQSSGSETVFYLDKITTLTGESIATTDFSIFGRGTITIDPLSSTDIEFASFTGVNATNLSLTGGVRGLSAKGNTSSTSRMPYHAVGTPIIISFGVHNLEDLKTYIDGLVAGTIGNASSTIAGVTKLSINPVSPTSPIAVGNNDPRVPAADPTTLFLSATALTGFISPYAGRTAPTGFLLCDGAAVSRTTYSALLAIVAPSGTFTVTIASPAVFTKTTHGYVVGDKVHFTTTGGLPSGLSTNTDYYIISAGLTANDFQLALSPSGSAITTSGSQLGVHTVYLSAYGKGDGSTTFNLPDLRSRMPVGFAATAPTQTLVFDTSQVDTTNDWVTILDTVFPSQGQKVQLTTTGTLPTGLSLATDYYIIRLTSTTIAFATSQANANASTKVDLTAVGSGVTTMTFTNRTHKVLGRMGGEETHALSGAELASHTHSAQNQTGPTFGGAGGLGYQSSGNIGSTGGDTQHNNMSPFIVLNWIIKF